MNSIVIFAVIFSVAQGEIITGSTPSTIADIDRTLVQTEPHDSNPQYSYSYSVADGLTGDNKAQEETRNGDRVRGSYSLVEPNGVRRVVSYASDPLSGFNAVVQRDPTISLSARTIATAPVYRTNQAGQLIDQQSLAAGGPTAIIATANANVHRQSTLLSASSPYLSHTGHVYAGSAVYSNQQPLGPYGPIGLIRVR